MKRLLYSGLLLSLAILAVHSQTSTNLRYITAQTVQIKDSTGFFSRTIGTLSLGDEVILISETNRWSQVRFANLTGWVSSSVLSTRRVVSSGSGGQVTEVALAGKGFSPDMELQFRREGLDYTQVDIMESMVISEEALLNFINEGRLRRGD